MAWSANRIIWGACAVMVAGIVIFSRSGGGAQSGGSITPEGAAKTVCSVAFKKYANDPASVSFDDKSTWIVGKESADVWSTTFGVRAKNAFGALVYGIYTCRTQRSGDVTTFLDMKQIGPP